MVEDLGVACGVAGSACREAAYLNKEFGLTSTFQMVILLWMDRPSLEAAYLNKEFGLTSTFQMVILLWMDRPSLEAAYLNKEFGLTSTFQMVILLWMDRPSLVRHRPGWSSILVHRTPHFT